MEHIVCAAQPHDQTEQSAANSIQLISRYRSALMGFAALWICFFHVWQPIIDVRHMRASWVENFIKTIGFYGVDIFLFLSGIGITYSLGKSKNVLAFYYKRLKRIIIPFVLVGVLNYYSKGWGSEWFWQNILCINFYRSSIYSHLWFVPAILTLYLFTPLYYWLFTKASGKIQFTFCAIIIWLMCTLFVRETLRHDLFGFTNRIPIFIIGMLTGWFVQKSNLIFNRLTWGLLWLIFLLGIYLAYLTGYLYLYILVPSSNCCLPTMLLSISTSFLLTGFLSFLNGKQYGRLLGKGLNNLLSFFGKFTLELYCVQEWLAEVLLPRISQYNAMIVNIILFSVIIIAALILYYVSKYFWIFVEWAVQKVYAIVGTKRNKI